MPGFDAKELLANLTQRPGVYRMMGADDEVLYVGKARNLKNRVSSYFRGRAHSAKTMRMLKQIADVEITVTNTETEALLLEYNLIKKFQPRFNVLLRDDKSFPYIYVTTDQEFSRLTFYRGSRKGKGRYFGPYPSTHAVRDTLSYLQKLFKLRQCEDTFFRNRSRPCLQYQIKRCSAPCVGLIDAEKYKRDVDDAILFLDGRSHDVIDGLARRMETASETKDYEQAAHYRDQITSLKTVQEKQFVVGQQRGDFDIVAMAEKKGTYCIAVMYIRSGRNLGSRVYFPKAASGAEHEEVMSAFLAQYYLAREAPPEVLISHDAGNYELLERTLGERAKRKVRIKPNFRGQRAKWMDMALTNARHALARRLVSNSTIARQQEDLRDVLKLDEIPQRIECFDISHTGGESTVASCVVFGPDGPIKSDYRRFNIKGVAGGDDYGAMRQAISRRYTRVKKGEAPEPDILLIDGGKGQVSATTSVLEELQFDDLLIVGVAKGPARRPGHEKLILSGKKRPIILPPESQALHLIQQVRDEAHRFAITGHRARREKKRRSSVLESIPGLGPKRRRELLRQFGGLQAIKRAGIDDLMTVPGISHRLAELIYESFHTRE